jgi:heme exporter protein C
MMVWVVILDWVLLMVAMTSVIFFTPPDAIMGVTQKIFYIHLPAAFAAFLAVTFLFVLSLAYLFRPGPRIDLLAKSTASPAWIFCTLTLVTGMIWARQAWLVWWAWDPRLTSFLLLWCILSAYIVLRRSLPPGTLQARLAAAFGILGFLDLPLVFFSIRYWRSLHPAVITTTRIHMAPPQFYSLILMSGAVLLLAGILVYLRYRAFSLHDRISSLIDHELENNK